MNAKLSKLAFLALLSFSIQLGTQAQEQTHSWKDTNNAAIQAMRQGQLEESEKLFKQALSECSDTDGKATINDNLNVLYEKEGKKQEGSVSASDNQSAASRDPIMDGLNNSASPDRERQIHQALAQLDAEIKKADDKADLEMLQALFQKKLQVLKMRDSGETLDYAYCMHFRAQVLHGLHRDEEANNLDAQATKLRDQLRRLQSTAAAAPAITKSGIHDLNFSAAPLPTQRTIQPYQENYANATPNPNRYAPRSWRNFMPANAGNTSGYLNGNPNQPANSW